MKRVVQSILGSRGLRLIRLEAFNNIEEFYGVRSFALGDEVDQLRRTNFELQPFRSCDARRSSRSWASLLGRSTARAPNTARPDTSCAMSMPIKAPDIGANVGLYTLLLAMSVGPSGLVFGVEPGPKSYSLLLRNVTVNGYRPARVENAAVSDHSGTVDLLICRTGESDNRIAGALLDHHERNCMPVRCVSIDTTSPRSR